MRRIATCFAGATLGIVGAALPVLTSPAHGDEFANPDGDGGIDYGIEIDPSSPYTESQGDYDYDSDDGYTPSDLDGSTDPLSPAELLEIDLYQSYCGIPGLEYAWCDAPPSVVPEEGEQQQAPPPVNPADLGQTLLDNMPLPSPDISIAPAPPRPTLVQLWTWFWVPEGQWQSQSDSITLGQTTVTVTIEPDSVVWSTGEGSTTCDGPGEPWTPGSDAETSSCGYEYEHTTVVEPGGKYTVSATIKWHASWTCSG
ncbi:MAG: hypothetical protein ACRDO7_01440, partial [Nocardioidaceae bacterium]